MHRAKLFELIGLVVLLFTAGWQFLIEDVAKQQVTAGRIFILDEKVDTIWGYLRDLGTSNDPEHLREAHERANKYFETTETFLGLWPAQSEIFSGVRTVLYVFGSLMLIFGKYFEYRFYKEQVQQSR